MIGSKGGESHLIALGHILCLQGATLDSWHLQLKGSQVAADGKALADTAMEKPLPISPARNRPMG